MYGDTGTSVVRGVKDPLKYGNYRNMGRVSRMN